MRLGQLQKMGVLPSSYNKSTTTARKKSTLGDLSKIRSSKPGQESSSSKKDSKAKKRGKKLGDSDSEDDDNDSLMGDDEYDDKVIPIDGTGLNDADQLELSEGLRNIKVGGRHSFFFAPFPLSLWVC